jgi:hypothetical protein
MSNSKQGIWIDQTCFHRRCLEILKKPPVNALKPLTLVVPLLGCAQLFPPLFEFIQEDLVYFIFPQIILKKAKCYNVLSFCNYYLFAFFA